MILSLLLALAVATPAPAATPAFQEYNDAAMHYVAPLTFAPVGQRQIPLDGLGQDPVVVAGWVIKNDPTRPKKIVIMQEAYKGSLDGFDQVFEQQMRSQYTAFFKDKERTTLKNGMPAYFMTGTWGTGFDDTKAYIMIWADGARGVALIVSSQVGQIDMPTAKAILSDCTAVAYPVGRDY